MTESAPWINKLNNQTLATCFVYAEAEGKATRVVVTTPAPGYKRWRKRRVTWPHHVSMLNACHWFLLAIHQIASINCHRRFRRTCSTPKPSRDTSPASPTAKASAKWLMANRFLRLFRQSLAISTAQLSECKTRSLFNYLQFTSIQFHLNEYRKWYPIGWGWAPSTSILYLGLLWHLLNLAVVPRDGVLEKLKGKGINFQYLKFIWNKETSYEVRLFETKRLSLDRIKEMIPVLKAIISYGFYFLLKKFMNQFFRFHLLKIDQMTCKTTCHLALILSENKVIRFRW